VEVKIDTNFKESAWIKVNIMGNDKLLFGCTYRSPSSDEENVKALNELLTKASFRNAIKNTEMLENYIGMQYI
jgi:hypothetical protein